jgi:sugar lactone lactonase YvrE
MITEIVTSQQFGIKKGAPMRASVRLVVTCLFSSALMACLTACYLFDHSSSTTPTPPHTPLPTGTNNYAVADWSNNRVLIYNAPFSTNQNASVVLGQSAFNSSSINAGGGATVAANGLSDPDSVAVDASGNLYVADGENSRVLQFKPPFTTNMNASVVFGQTAMNQNNCAADTGATASGLCGVWLFVAVDGDGDLWVADSANSRIVEYMPPFTTGKAATLAIGQSTTGALAANPCNEGAGPGSAPTSSTLCFASGQTFDSSGNLWVADTNNNRVLEFKPPFATGMAASLELGQPSGATAFTTFAINNGGSGGNPIASSLFGPVIPLFDARGNLWVADSGNARVLMYAPPFSNGMNATLELGDPAGAAAFTTRNASLTQSGMFYPLGLSLDTEGDIIVSDFQFNRVTIFEPPFSNGMNATTVLGQPDFTHSSVNQGGTSGANTFNQPAGGVTF